MRTRLALLFSAFLNLAVVNSAWAVSDDANPWLAIENAVCVSHRGVNYSDKVGAKIVIKEAQWRGSADGLPTHCFLSGTIEEDMFEILLPTQGNGQTYARANGLNDIEAAHLALSQGFAVLFRVSNTRAAELLKAAAEHHYAPLGFRP